MKHAFIITALVMLSPYYSFAQSERYDTLFYRGKQFVINVSMFHEEVFNINYADGHGDWSRQYTLNTRGGNDDVVSFVVFTGKVDIPEACFLNSLKLLDKQTTMVDTTIVQDGLFFHLWYDTIHNVTYYSRHTRFEEDLLLNAVVNQIDWIDGNLP